MKVYVKTYGCQMNVRDSESIAVDLVNRGHELAATEREADVVLVNTCSVRGKAEDKALGKLGLLVATKRDNPLRIVGAMGCMVARLKGQIFEKVRGLDFAVGPKNASRVADALEQVRDSDEPVLLVGGDYAEEAMSRGHRVEGICAFVNILVGCDRRCTYCIVPDVRGSEWSRAGEDVVPEIEGLVELGVKEVTLLGQSVMSYGRKNDVWAGPGSSPGGFTEPLPRLLEAVGSIDGIDRVRFTSGHPSGCTDELARVVAEVPAVCEHLHLPLQSGSDRILKKMRRGYTAGDYIAAAARLRERASDMSLTTDIIVGFPSETEAEFEETRAFMDQIGFDNAFIFKYSPRPGTPAAEWNDDVPDDEKVRRNAVLLEDQDRRCLAIHEALIGKDVEVLAAGESLRNPERWAGRTRTNKIVVFDPPAGVKTGQLLKVNIKRATAQTLFGVA